ncbi:MAG: 5'-nucleotidase, lipoprotein e(P4) family [Salinivirgaceae bacterium]|nr:MAG: 5'-nucleotidase, lipoprotein e(P4) family [Salinivirgaceae bacterium]
MKNLILILLSLSIVISCQQHITKKQEKTNSSEYLLLSTAWFQLSAEQKALFYQAYNIAKLRIDEIASDKAYNNPAVVLDIDETVLDNSPYQAWCVENDSTFSKKTWDIWVKKAEAELLSGALDFTNYAKSKGVEVIYISNRSVSQLNATIQNMKNKNLPNAEKDFVLLKDSTSDKTFRRDLINEKYEIALLIGDNLGDFDHVFDHRNEKAAHKAVEDYKTEFGKKFIVLPNPMYGKWERPYQKMEGEYIENLKKQLKSFTY